MKMKNAAIDYINKSNDLSELFGCMQARAFALFTGLNQLSPEFDPCEGHSVAARMVVDLEDVKELAAELNLTTNLAKFVSDMYKYSAGMTYSLTHKSLAENCVGLCHALQEAQAAVKPSYPQFLVQRKSADPIVKSNQRKVPALKILRGFACLCGKENRENIECIIADLKKDATKMRKDKRQEWFIQSVLLWHVFPKTILPIIWDKARRILTAILAVEEIIKKIKGQ